MNLSLVLGDGWASSRTDVPPGAFLFGQCSNPEPKSWVSGQMEMGEFYNLSGCTILRSWDMLITSVVEPVTGAGTVPWLSRSHRSGVTWNWVDLIT